MSEDKKYFTRQGLADYLGISLSKVYKMKLPFREGLITLEEFEMWRRGDVVAADPKAPLETLEKPNKKGFATV